MAVAGLLRHCKEKKRHANESITFISIKACYGGVPIFNAGAKVSADIGRSTGVKNASRCGGSSICSTCLFPFPALEITLVILPGGFP
jgi:hypothetical protein